MIWLVGSIALCLSATPSLAAAPVNLAPNSQWEIMSGLGFSAKWNVEGSGSMNPIAVSGNTIGLNRVVLTAAGPTENLKVDDLVTLRGQGVDPALTRRPMRVVALERDRSVTVQAPFGAAPRVSRPATLLPVNIGGDASTHTGDAVDRWSKTITMPVWREDNAANVSPGATYALAAHKDGDDPESVWFMPDIARFRGRTVVFGANVFQKIRGGAGAWRVFIGSGGPRGATATSAPGPTAAGYHWLEVSYAVPAEATSLSVGVRLDGTRGDTYYITDPVFTVGEAIGPDNYVKPQELFIPIVHVSPWINETLRLDAAADPSVSPYRLFDLYADSGGQVAPTVRWVEGAIEGVSDDPIARGPDHTHAISWTNRKDPPNLFGPILGQYASGVKSFGAFAVPLDATGRSWFTSGSPGERWYNVSIDLTVFLLQ